MPTYIYTAPDGRKIKVSGDAPPSEQELAVIFKNAGVLNDAETATSAPDRSWTDVAVDALPTVAAGVGGVLGGAGGTAFGLGFGGVPGAVGGATLGGAAGESARQLINRVRGKDAPATSAEAAKAIAGEGAVQGASEVAGAGLVKGAGMAAHGLMDFALRPAPTLVDEFGDVAATALKERVPVGSILPGGAKGSNKAGQVVREAASETRGLLDNAGQMVKFKAEGIARGPVTELAGKIAKQPLSESELSQLSNLFSEYLNTQTTRMHPRAVKDMKQAAQRIAKPIFKALNQGNIPPAGESLKAQFNKAIADGAKDALETIPGVGASEARTQAAIGLNKVVRRAEGRRLPLVAEIAAPVAGGVAGGVYGGDAGGVAKGVSATVLTRALLSPRTTSRAALALTNEQIKAALQQMPRASVYALLSEVTGTSPESE